MSWRARSGRTLLVMHSDPAAAGRRALADRARRISRIRRRIAAAAVSAFALVWGLIAATGSMGSQATATTVSTTQATTTTSSQPSESSQSSDSGLLPSVTTGQS
ncbi:MAG: hypothetical protein ABW081_13580 [Solirubrobacteraceae bacterium]